MSWLILDYASDSLGHARRFGENQPITEILENQWVPWAEQAE